MTQDFLFFQTQQIEQDDEESWLAEMAEAKEFRSHQQSGSLELRQPQQSSLGFESEQSGSLELQPPQQSSLGFESEQSGSLELRQPQQSSLGFDSEQSVEDHSSLDQKEEMQVTAKTPSYAFNVGHYLKNINKIICAI